MPDYSSKFRKDGQTLRISVNRFRHKLPERLQKKGFYEEFSIKSSELIKILFQQGIIDKAFRDRDTTEFESPRVELIANKASAMGFHSYTRALSKPLANKLNKACDDLPDSGDELVLGGAGFIGLGALLSAAGLATNLALTHQGVSLMSLGGVTCALSRLEKELHSKSFGGKPFKDYAESLKLKKKDLLYWHLNPFSNIQFESDVKKVKLDGKIFSPDTLYKASDF
ncbi:MAG: hypothetical protein GOU97_03120 [Nanoarchaeota archaeon]|nr:hypothetical protein [Nanoarchaeota archaeon]